MQINKLFDYKSFNRIETREGRKYAINGMPLPSVTTILSATADKTYLEEWKNRLGASQALKITTEAAGIGSNLHTNLENYIFDKDMIGTPLSKMMANLVIKNGLCKVSEVYGSEVTLYCNGLYAGTTDLVANFNGRLSIIDFKNARRPKKDEWITDYKAQLGAYAIAHDEMFGTNIDQGVIMVATRELQYQEFVYTGADMEECKVLWATRLSQFYDLISKKQQEGEE